MLVLTRKSEQKILIGEQIVITVLKVYGDQVSIGIEAPADMRIFREELVKGNLNITVKDSNTPYSSDVSKIDHLNKGRHQKNTKYRLHKQPLVEASDEA
ncbi:MAG: carbon storage regulator [Parachlamydiales bacterium]|nr:carbon storage regulator [Parachlamydiales bacterium]